MASAEWRLAKSLGVLRAEVNATWPRRSKVSDGTVGDLAHASRTSDHNPNAAGVVRALDITAYGIDAHGYAERLRHLGASGHRPLRNGGVIIWNRRIASSKNGWQWRPYTGANPHDKHVHVSVSRDAADYDALDPWGVRAPIPEEGFMPHLSEAEQRELLDRVRNAETRAGEAAMLAASVDQRCARLEASVHGVDDETRANSLWWKVEYLHGEVLENENVERLRRILSKFGGE